jgi:hypothetical protein
MTPQQKASAELLRWQTLRHLKPAERIEAIDAEPVSPPLTEEEFQIAQSNVEWEMSPAS